MTLRSLIKVAEKYAVDNSPTLISAIAVSGTLTTAFLTGKATFKAADIIAAEQTRRSFSELEEHVKLTKKDKTKLVWKCYIPPALAVAGTIGCIITANSISASRLAGMAAAYKLSEKQYKEYEDKIKEKLGLKEEQRARDEMYQEQLDRNPPPAPGHGEGQVIPGGGNVLFRESWTGRYFYSTMETVKAAQNTINYRMISDNYATLSDFYEEIGLANTQESSEVGWSIEQPVELYFSTGSVNGIPCHVMEYHNRPIAIRDHHYRGIH